MDANANDKKRPVHRSPSYPAIPLEKAVERARVFYNHEKRSSANSAVALRHWGYGPVSGGGRVLLAALLAFGLMRDEGSGDARQVKLSELALRIILDDREDSPDRMAALREAALQPKIYRELLAKWPGLEVSDANLRHFLLIEKKFNDGAVKDFIRDLRSTVSFAQLTASLDNQAGEAAGAANRLADGRDDVDESPAPAPAPTQHALKASPPFAAALPMPMKGTGMRQEVFALAEGDVTIQWPERLSVESLEDFTDWLRILERKIKRAVIAPQPPSAGGESGVDDLA